MSKVTKLIQTPSLFFKDALRNRGILPAGAESKGRHPEGQRPAPARPMTAPVWYRPEPTEAFTARLAAASCPIVYLPWVDDQTHDLIESIERSNREAASGSGKVDLVALEIFDNLPAHHHAIRRFVQDFPDLWRKMLLRHLLPLQGRIPGVILPQDWHPLTHGLARACQEIGLRTAVIPHASPFPDPEEHYRHLSSRTGCPIADAVLCCSEAQARILVDRGYPPERTHLVQPARTACLQAYRQRFDRRQVLGLLGLDPERPTLLLAGLPEDAGGHRDPDTRDLDLSTVADLISVCQEIDHQLCLHLSTCHEDRHRAGVMRLFTTADRVAIDGGAFPLFPFREMLTHCDMVLSFRAETLQDAVAMGKPALLLDYSGSAVATPLLPFERASSRSEILTCLSRHQTQCAAPACPAPGGPTVHDWLVAHSRPGSDWRPRDTPTDRFFRGERIDVAAFPDPYKHNTQKYLPQLLRANSLVPTRGSNPGRSAHAAEVFVQWGNDFRGTRTKLQQRHLAREIGRPTIYVEDGFIRSVDIGLSGEATLSIILDDCGAYYEAERPTRLQRLLNTTDDLSPSELERARNAIAKIVRERISKYNHAPIRQLDLGRKGRSRILLVDQRFGDQSVLSGLANEQTFERMLDLAVTQHPDRDIVIKQHPDAIKGGKESFLHAGLINRYRQRHDSIFAITHDINPYCLFDAVDEVWVATSGMGFEALMAGKTVHCFGAPFYAGRGLTTDHVSAPHRTRHRTLEEVFHYAYIVLSRYHRPDLEGRAELEDLIDYIVQMRAVSGAATRGPVPA